jgi:hypothetical protein
MSLEMQEGPYPPVHGAGSLDLVRREPRATAKCARSSGVNALLVRHLGLNEITS